MKRALFLVAASATTGEVAGLTARPRGVRAGGTAAKLLAIEAAVVLEIDGQAYAMAE